jgi:ankyrin repeat protein
MKKEEWDPWSRVVHEMDSILVRDEIHLLEKMINDEDVLLDISLGSITKVFDANYPALTWIISRIATRNVVVPFLFAIGRYDLFRKDLTINHRDLNYIGDIFPSLEFAKKYRVFFDVNDRFFYVYLHRNAMLWILKFEELYPRIIDCNKLLNAAVEKDYDDITKILLKDKRTTEYNYALQTACQLGAVNTLKVLLDDARVDLSKECLHSAIRYSHTDVVKLLLEDPRLDLSNNRAILIACDVGCIDVIKLLLSDPRIDPSVNDNEAIISSSKAEVVRLLLTDKRVDPSVHNNEATFQAYARNRWDIVNLLVADYRVDLFENNSLVFKKACLENDIYLVNFLLRTAKSDVQKIIKSVVCFRDSLKSEEDEHQDRRKMMRCILYTKFIKSDTITEIINWCDIHGDVHTIRILLTDYRCNYLDVMRRAVFRQSIYLVRITMDILLKYRGIASRKNIKDFLRTASTKNNAEIVAILLEHPACDPSLRKTYFVDS